MNKYRSNIILITVFFSYILLTGVFTIKDNWKKIGDSFNTLQDSEKYSQANSIDKVIQIKDCFDNTFSANLFGKYDYIDIYGGFQKILQKNVVEDVEDDKRVVKLNNGNLAFLYPEKNMDDWVKKITAVSDYSKQNNIYMLYVDAPWRITSDNLPFYLKDNVNKTDKQLTKSLKKNNVNVLQLKNELPGNVDNWFFKTDHHWNIETAFESYKIIIKKINENVNLNLKEEYLNKFSKKIYKNIFLGTYGKRVGKNYAGIDDFAYILPEFDTKFEVTNNLNWNKEQSHLIGNFEKVFTYPEYLEKEELDRKMSTYYTYTEGIKAEIKIENMNAYNDKKILVLTDSFGETVFPFISLNFKETRAIDVRRFKAIRLYKYIESFKPDVLIFIHTPTSLYDDSLINFQLK